MTHEWRDDSDYATAEKITSHERALKSLVRFNAKLKRFAQHLPLRGFSVHKFPIIGRALVKKLNFITIKPSLHAPCFRWFSVNRATWFRKWKHSELALLSIVWEWWKCLAEFHFQTLESQRVRVMPRRLFLIQLSQPVKALESTLENPRHFSASSLRRGGKVHGEELIAELRRKEIQSESDSKQHQLSVKLTSIIFDYQTRVNHESSSFRFLVCGPRSSPPRSDLLKAH